MQFLNDIIILRHGFKTAQKFHKFRVPTFATLLRFCEQAFSLGRVGEGNTSGRADHVKLLNILLVFMPTDASYIYQ